MKYFSIYVNYEEFTQENEVVIEYKKFFFRRNSVNYRTIEYYER